MTRQQRLICFRLNQLQPCRLYDPRLLRASSKKKTALNSEPRLRNERTREKKNYTNFVYFFGRLCEKTVKIIVLSSR
jgi:hypothetical protein